MATKELSIEEGVIVDGDGNRVNVSALHDNGSYVSVAAGRALGLPAQASVTIDPTTAVATNVTTPDVFPTGLTDNSVVEPSIYYNPNGKFGYKYWFLACPFYNSDATVENPTLWVSNTGQNDWIAAPGAPAPLVANGVGGAGYGTNSDGSLCEGPDGRFYVFWNQFLPASGWGVRMISSADAITWTSPVTVITTVLATSRPTCPSVFYDPFLAKWVMYAVEIAVAGGSPYTLMRYTADAAAGPWTQSAAPTYTHPTSGHSPYHLNAHLIGDQHVLLIADATNNATNGGNLYLATSNDRGASFASSALVLSGRGGGYWDNALYRADFVPTWRNGRLVFDLWYGGNTGVVWGLGHSLLTFNDSPMSGIATPGVLTADMLKMLAATKGLGAYVYGDTMVRTDSTSSPGTADYAPAAYTVVAGTWGILGYRLYISAAANSKITVNVGLADVVFECKLAMANTDQLWMIGRYTDTNNYIRAGVQGLLIRLQTVIAGSVTDLPVSSTAGFASGDILKVVFNGTSIKVYRNGLLVPGYSVTSSFNQGAGVIGFQANTTTAFFKNAHARALVGGA